MGLTAYLNHTPSKLSFFAWNINGLSSKSLGDKLQNVGCLKVINGYDFVILSETWSESNIEVAGYRSVVTGTSKTAKSGRNSGGLALLYKNEFHDWISVDKASPNFLWYKISKNYTKTTKDIFVCREVALTFRPIVLITFTLNCSKISKVILKTIPPKDRFSSWVI